MFLDQIKLPYKQGRVEWDGRGESHYVDESRDLIRPNVLTFVFRSDYR